MPPVAPKLEIIIAKMKSIRDGMGDIIKNYPELMEDHPTITPNNRDKYTVLMGLRYEYIDSISSYLTDPDLYPYIKCWKITITGKSELSEEDVKNIKYENEALVVPDGITKDDYVNKIINKATGVLGNSIRSFLIANKFKIADASTTSTDWTIGFNCTEEESHKLCKIVYGKFKKAIDAQLFKIQRRICEPEFTNP